MTDRPIVIDASVAIAIVRDEPDGRLASNALERWQRDGRRLLVPSHFWLELVNALARRHRWAGDDILHAIHVLDGFEFDTVPPDRSGVVLINDLVERHGLTAYDAAYLALADASDGHLATLDSALRQAAGRRFLGLGDHLLSEGQAAYEHDVTWPDYKGASAYLAQLRASVTNAS